ncbi:ATP-binding cassette domain-containing protein [Herbiconiux daphne]|uniref:Dipeptide/oligopeptide/nickel ABC transporter ATP-binding protein n=1 Tax=Herbiconiux daphne TaxID=2970914 RepID=A0ABT2H1W6_9MICO|nr:dipeptide/oligopeptide/nickel ABC transporter ATP-binding protein [Herbiconiux daphne]MCS5733901.1 dipeptide/oligopeptide/nickel ABC transporter ATP-binding protein [Herbiconiux daphne]
MADRNILTASDVTVEYPAHSVSSAFTAVKGFTLTIRPGEIVGLVGSSGSGKSTLAQIASGQAALRGSKDNSPRIIGGSLDVLGFEMRGIKRSKLNKLTLGVGFVSQDAGSNLTSNMTVAELVAEPLFLRDKRYNRQKAGLKAATLVDALLLPVGSMLKYPHELSSGQRQRVAVARGLILDPVLLIADEPTAGVDVSVRGAVVDVIAGLQRSRGASALIVSHDLETLRRSVDRIAVIHEGVVVGLGPIDDVLGDPRHPYVAGLARESYGDDEYDDEDFDGDGDDFDGDGNDLDGHADSNGDGDDGPDVAGVTGDGDVHDAGDAGDGRRA